MDNNNYQNQFGNMPVLPQGNAPKKSNTRKIVTVIVAIVVIIAAVAVGVLIGGMSENKSDKKDNKAQNNESDYSVENYEKSVDNYFDAYFKGKVDKIEDCMPKEVWEYAAETLKEEGIDVDGADDLIQGCKDGYLEDYEDNVVDGDYGEFKKYDYEIEEADEVSDSKLEKIAEALDERYEIDEDDVKKAYKLKLDGEIVFEDDEIDLDDAGLDELYSVKIGGKWYLVAGDDDYYYLIGSGFVSYYDWEN